MHSKMVRRSLLLTFPCSSASLSIASYAERIWVVAKSQLKAEIQRKQSRSR